MPIQATYFPETFFNRDAERLTGNKQREGMIKILTTPTLEIMIFVSPTTSRHVVEKRLRQVVEQRNLPIKVTKINVVHNPEVAEEYDIVACPTLIFSGYMRICGVFELNDLEEMVTNYFGAGIEGHSNGNSLA